MNFKNTTKTSISKMKDTITKIALDWQQINKRRGKQSFALRI
ncbi:hypothetical protein BAZSYMA_ACONTIG16246_1 [Bathymodiolus azoricus thioautotrophic gill symbiont]|uniref:Uncharacterized protein n=1 Tax=Bathymodiolus azoricus thioautotrophic gill symbiont TaxID=235205 RepID=A0A1H6K3M9_9GAMM|nr:hypothetical protein BAZSYMA_ACONTIG16246_1 [Bathymodiolus azoricus thioautotrophic gill symbiont]